MVQETRDRHQAPARAPRRLVDDRRRARQRRVRHARRGARGWRPADIQEQVTESGLRGRGGAGFGTGQKWSFLPEGRVPALPRRQRRRGRAVDVQGPHARRARSAPADRRDRDHRAYAIQCHHAFIYLRGEFALGVRAARRRRSPTRTRTGFIGKNILGSGFDLEIVVHRGAGCVHLPATRRACSRASRASAAMPRIKPPFPAMQGLYAKPTVVNNVETLSTVPHIIEHGAEWYAKIGVNRSTGTRIFSVSGARRAARQLRGRARHARSATSSTASPAASGTATSLKFFIPGGASLQWLHRTRAPRRAARHGLRAAATSSTMLGSGRDHGVRRDHRPAAASRGGWRSSSPTSRAASARRAVRARLDREGAVPHGATG